MGVGRVGGLAVALGIGAAVVAAPGLASADPSGDAGSPSPSSATSSSSTGSSGSAAPASGAPSTGPRSGSSATPTGSVGGDTPSSQSTTSAVTPSKPKPKPPIKHDEPSSPAEPSQAENITTPKDVDTETETETDEAADVTPVGALQLDANPPKDSRHSGRAADPVAGPAPNDTTDRVTVLRAQPTVSTSVLANVAAPEVRQAPMTSAPVTGVYTAPADVQQPQALSPPDPAAVVTTAIASLVSSIMSPLAGDGPTAPMESPLLWTLAAAARREITGTVPAPTAPATSLTTSLTTATPASVVAIPQTPPLAFLQQLPVIGPLFVTPIVAAIHQIPLISDFVHPFIGYPLEVGVPAGSPMSRDVRVVSFDGTQIYTHFMPALGLRAGQRAPTILNGPGLGLPGATNLNGALFDDIVTDFFGQVSVGTLRAAGYNVVTFDPRGEYYSDGALQIDAPEFEGRDVSAIISWLATQPEVQLDDVATLDPRLGLVGVSYGGGIQLVAAAIDHRIDAIVPTIAWNTLNSSLYKDGAFKSSWGTLLGGVLLATLAQVNPLIYPALITGDLSGMLSQAEQDLLADRGPGGIRDLVNDITVPTLLIQGTVDTLFTLAEADANAQTLIANSVPTKVLWFCGGHGLCLNNLFDLSDGVLIKQRTLEWLHRYVKGDVSVSTGPQFEWVDQRGKRFSSDVYPIVPGTPIVASSSAGAVLPLIPYIFGSGLPVIPLAFPATNAVNLTVPTAATTAYLVGAPQLTLSYSGTGSARHVYAQLVDDTTGLVLGNVATPIPVTLDGQTHTLTLSLEPIAHTLAPGETVTLQIVASAGLYERVIPSLGALTVSSIRLGLPTAADAMSEPSPLPAQTTVA